MLDSSRSRVNYVGLLFVADRVLEVLDGRRGQRRPFSPLLLLRLSPPALYRFAFRPTSLSIGERD